MPGRRYAFEPPRTRRDPQRSDRGVMAARRTAGSKAVSGGDQGDALPGEPKTRDQGPHDDDLVGAGIRSGPEPGQERLARAALEPGIALQATAGRRGQDAAQGQHAAARLDSLAWVTVATPKVKCHGGPSRLAGRTVRPDNDSFRATVHRCRGRGIAICAPRALSAKDSSPAWQCSDTGRRWVHDRCHPSRHQPDA